MPTRQSPPSKLESGNAGKYTPHHSVFGTAYDYLKNGAKYLAYAAITSYLAILGGCGTTPKPDTNPSIEPPARRIEFKQIDANTIDPNDLHPRGTAPPPQ